MGKRNSKLSAAIEIAKPYGGEVSITNGTHIRVVLPNGKTVFTSFTASDWRSEKNFRAQIRKALK